MQLLGVIDEVTSNPKAHGQKGVPADADEWSGCITAKALVVQHIGHRVNPGHHRNPSLFAMGDFQTLKQTLEEAPPTGLIFEVFGVQPGISKRCG